VSTATSPDPAAVATELERLAGSQSFRKAERCLCLLRHLTSQALEGRGSELKEYSLGVTVFGRPASYDPRIDPIVRLEARRLRLKLAEYYQQEGVNDPVVIDLPKGGYLPDFRFRRAEAETPPEPPAASVPNRHLPIRLAAAALLVVVAAACWYAFRTRQPGVPARPSVAVLGFRDLSAGNESRWISAALSELMNIDLGAEQRLRTAPLENVARMRTELSLAPQSTYPVELLERIRMNLASDYLVSGSYSAPDGRVHLDVMLVDARSGRQIAAIADDAVEEHLPELAQRCAQQIRAQLGARLPPSGRPSFEASAMQPYARGMESLRQGDPLSGRAYLEKAAAAAPSNPLVHSGLAEAWSALGLDIRAGQEAKLAFDSSAALERVEQLEIEGRYRSIANDWPRAIQIYQALYTVLPDDLEYGLLLASAQSHGGKAQEAFATIRALRSLPAPLRDDPRIDMAEARAAGAVSDFARTRQLAHQAGEKAAAHGARLQYARARLLESGAMQTLAVAGYAEVRLEARRICAELGDRACVAAAYRIEANQMSAIGNLAAAQNLYRAAFDIANQIGSANEKLNALMGLANASKLEGDLRTAEGYYQAALPVGTEMGPAKSYPVSLDLAGVLAEAGRIVEARALIDQALQVARQIGDREGIALCQGALAHTMALQGRLAEALGSYTEALAVLRQVNEPYELLETLLEVGNTQLEQDDLPAARKSFEETRALAHSFPDGFAGPEIEMAFARLSFAESHFPDAASHARLALAGFAAAGRQGDRFQAAAILTRALIAQGSLAEASAVFAQVPLPDFGKLPAESILEFQIARCFLLAHTGRREEAVHTMDLLSAEAARSGVPKLAKDALEASKAIAKVSRS